MNIGQVQTLLSQFRSEFERNGDMQECKKMLSQLKIALTQFGYLLPSNSKPETTLAREVLELAALLAVKLEDVQMFERHIAQLKAYYFEVDKLSELPESGRQYPLLGLNLLKLLTQNRMAEFHTELELIPHEMLTNVYISHPVELERLIMEGSYSKVMKMRESAPSEYYSFFLDMLLDTIRGEVADCFEKSYDNLPLDYVQRMLFVDDPMEMTDFAENRKWTIEGDRVRWNNKAGEETSQIPSTKLIRQTIAYAREFEKIV